ncbi:MAG: Uncharacterised protein [Porticoccaceae bacterium UBA1117]|nr:MAG: Uncharacterised protein [Porticoccaceae bacterium UBA1117]
MCGQRLSNSQRGFTLLEVLLAGFILFLVLTTMTQVYQGAVLSSGKAEESLSIVSAVPIIRIIVSDAVVEEGILYGERTFGELNYTWSAKLAYEGLPSQILLEDKPDIKYYLWDITLRVYKDSSVRQYYFREISS